MEFFANNIRNVAVFGHQGSGKTSLAEALFAVTTPGSLKGSVEKKNTISDFLNEEKTRLTSCSLAVVPFEYKGHKVNVLDVPGNDDFLFDAIGATNVAEGAIVVLDATKKVEVEAIKHFKILKKRQIPTLIFFNKMEKEGADFDTLLEDVKARLGKQCIPFALPIFNGANFVGYVNVLAQKAYDATGKEMDIPADLKARQEELYGQIMEQVALTDDALLEKFFGGEEISEEEINKALKQALLDNQFNPILVGSSFNNVGLTHLLDIITGSMPSPADLPLLTFKGEKKAVKEEDPFMGYVFKTTVDPYSGTISLIKVVSGAIHTGDEILSANNNKPIRLSGIAYPKGKEQIKVDVIHAGDIVSLGKLEDVETNFTVCDKNISGVLGFEPFPSPVYYRALSAENKKDEEKINIILNKVLKESPSVELKRNNETKQLTIGGLSDTHLRFIAEKLKANYSIGIVLDTPKVTYRETIKATAQAPGRYVKQSGGSGHYGVVEMRFEPCEENCFAEEIFGGAVSKGYFPAVEKGFYEAVASGPLAGFPVVGVKAVLVDGKEHPVDSDELAFKMASVLAFREAYPKCKPTILEPIMKVTIHVENQYIGNILSDLNLRRARVQDTAEHGDETEVIALAPESEILDYATKLRVLTQGGGSFTREFDSFQEVPSNLQDKVLRENSLLKQEEKK